jgi:hypothetical protein
MLVVAGWMKQQLWKNSSNYHWLSSTVELVAMKEHEGELLMMLILDSGHCQHL